jgi:hypothetical protein
MLLTVVSKLVNFVRSEVMKDFWSDVKCEYRDAGVDRGRLPKSVMTSGLKLNYFYK